MSHHDYLIKQAKDKSKIRDLKKKEKLIKEMEECTFFPNNNYKK